MSMEIYGVHRMWSKKERFCVCVGKLQGELAERMMRKPSLRTSWLHSYKCLIWVLNEPISIEHSTMKGTKLAGFTQHTKQPRETKGKVN